MFTILGGDGQEYGPATVEQIRSWMAAGRANLETQARAAGSEEWRRLGDYPEFSRSARVGGAVDAESSAAATSGSAAPTELLDPNIPRPPLNIFSCLDRSFALWRAHFLPLVGATLLVVFIQIFMNVVPIVGTFAGLLLNGVFYGGLYYFYLGKIRGERRSLADIFAGFSRAFVPLMLATVLTNLLLLLVAVTFFRPLVKALMSGTTGLPQLPTFDASSTVFMFVGVLIAAYLSVAWSFTFALIVDKRMGAWAAMEASRRIVTRQWFRVFLLCFCAGILAMLGVIALFVGLIFTLPLAFAPLLYAYEDLCHAPTAATPAIDGDTSRSE